MLNLIGALVLISVSLIFLGQWIHNDFPGPLYVRLAYVGVPLVLGFLILFTQRPES